MFCLVHLKERNIPGFEAYIAVSRYSMIRRAESLCCRSSGTNKASVAVLHLHDQSNIICVNIPPCHPPTQEACINWWHIGQASQAPPTYFFSWQPKQSSLPAVFDPVHVPKPWNSVRKKLKMNLSVGHISPIQPSVNHLCIPTAWPRRQEELGSNRDALFLNADFCSISRWRQSLIQIFPSQSGQTTFSEHALYCLHSGVLRLVGRNVHNLYVLREMPTANNILSEERDHMVFWVLCAGFVATEPDCLYLCSRHVFLDVFKMALEAEAEQGAVRHL